MLCCAKNCSCLWLLELENILKDNSLEFASYHSKVSWVLLTNQRAVFQQGIATLFKNLFMTLAPTILKDLEREHFGVCTLQPL